MSKSWIVQDFGDALKQFEDALIIPADSDLVKAGCIQYFEFTFELAWKAIKFLVDDLGLPECVSPKTCIRQAFASRWIDNEEVWLEMLDARNRMSHTYKAQEALKIYGRLADYSRELRVLYNKVAAVKP